MFDEYEELKLTYQELKEIEGYEEMTEKEAKKIIDTVFLLSKMAFNAYKNKM